MLAMKSAALPALLVVTVVMLGLVTTACRRKASSKQCDELIDRFAELVVKEHFPDAGAAVINAERQRERAEAQGDPFKNCTSEVQLAEHACAMKATSSEAMIHCLE